MYNSIHAPRVFAIADLHLDVTGKKSMEVFGPAWESYEERIFQNWKRSITDEDLVLLPGDISWALRLEDAIPDLQRIEDLPGTKLMLRGNHDYWWQSRTKIENLGFQTIHILQNDIFEWNDVVVYGTRGWSTPTPNVATQDDIKIFRREVERLRLSLAKNSSAKWRIVMFHYPPFDGKQMPNELWSLITQAGIHTCVYGHLHGYGHAMIMEGKIDGISLHCVSADYVEFTPKELTREVNDESSIG